MGLDVEKVSIGAAVEERYKQLGLTQDSLAFLAGVSNSTVRNVLHSRVNEARTWPRVERALGWMPGSLNRLRDGDQPEDVLPVDGLKSLHAAFLRLAAEAEDDEVVDITLGLYEEFVRSIAQFDSGQESDFAVRETIDEVWDSVSPHLSPAEAEPLLEAFRDFGWRTIPPVSLPPGLVGQPLERAGSARMSASGGNVAVASAAAPAPADGQHDDAEPDDVMSPEEEAFDEAVSRAGDRDVSLRWLGDGVNLGLIQLRVNVPVGPIPVRLLTYEDLRVIADTVEAQVAQMAKSLANSRGLSEKQRPTRTRVEKQIQELQDEIQFGWERQLRLVADLRDAGVEIGAIATSIGEPEKDVWKMLQQAATLFPTSHAKPWKSTRCGHRPDIVGLLDGALDSNDAERTLQEIASCSECSEKYQKLREHREIRQKVKEMYESGKGVSEINDALGIDRAQTYAYLHGAEVALREESGD